MVLSLDGLELILELFEPLFLQVVLLQLIELLAVFLNLRQEMEVLLFLLSDYSIVVL